MKLNRAASILVTGSAGSIGRAAVSGLSAAGWRVRGFDRLPTPATGDYVVGDLTDSSALRKAADGAGAIIHLAAIPDDDDFLSRLLPNNLVGLHNLLEAARVAGVQRVLLASTGQVVWWRLLEGPWPIGPDAPYTPRDWYAVTKITAEAAGRTYARNHNMTVLALRLGWFPRNREHAAEVGRTVRGPNIYLSPGDAGRFFAQAMEAPLEPGFAVLFVASRPTNRIIFDLEPTKRLVGWEPKDQWPVGVEHLLEAPLA
ncbi:MAG: NAD(P)-dependent oxidoreductase [Verrucomicrobia bacterium]|nr:NAD(P)-dependent oxidoreductase [Verrucomicrobiota bacterium]